MGFEPSTLDTRKQHYVKKQQNITTRPSKFYNGSSRRNYLSIRDTAATARFYKLFSRLQNRFARWYISRPKTAIWVNFGGSCNERCCYILWTYGLFYRHLIFLWPYGIFCGNLVYIHCFGILYEEKSGNPGASKQ
jgi:hypothetical protein